MIKMPVKKTDTTKTTEKKTTTKKVAAKVADKKETVAKKTTKKATEKTTKKVAEKKTTTAKKTTTKKAAATKQDVQKYIDVINWKKGEAQGMDWLYIELNAGNLNEEVEAGVANLATVCEAMRTVMLEGDEFIEQPARKSGANLTIRYYCDNLSADRRKYSEVND